ncbi:MAG TPA: sugar phosphorylase [Chloroflexota bacterium]|nr:sugar phosphorylase [Chloroflexota bacterium]
MNQRIRSELSLIYPEQAAEVATKLSRLLDDFTDRNPPRASRDPFFTERDAVLICYADHVREEGEKTLRTMGRFLERYARGLIPTVHFLPFFPYSSDDGFSVIDYRRIEPAFGDWDDLAAIARDFDVMVDLVINHASAKSEWFGRFLEGDEVYRDYFIAFEEPVDLSTVFRPRTHPVLTPFQTAEGTRYVWTTFSTDQIDLNVANPDVLLELIRILLFYVAHGATIIRLDAIAFLWKEPGTSSLHLPQTHAVVRLLRAVLDEVAPQVLIITETNVPHEDNISYFGAGEDEAHLVYNFTLPPLLLYSLMKGDASLLSTWARTLAPPSARTAFFNFTASHDGIGVTALRAMIPPDEFDEVLSWVERHGGRINYRTSPGQEPVPYELNIVYLDAAGGIEPFLVSQAIALALQGMPAIYFNSLIGARNWEEGVERLGYNRAINRQKFVYDTLVAELDEPASPGHRVYQRYARLLAARGAEPLFGPLAPQQVVDLDRRLFALLRSNEDRRLLAIHNLSGEEVIVSGLAELLGAAEARDAVSGETYALTNSIRVEGYGILWLTPER